MRRILGLCLALLVAGSAVVGAGRPVAAQAASSAPHASMAGFELSLPAGWVTVDIPGGMMFVASGQQALEGARAVPDGARIILVNTGREDSAERPLGDLLEVFIASQQVPGEVTSCPEETVLGGQQSARLEGAGEIDGVRFVYLGAAIGSGTRVGIIVAMLPQALSEELLPLVEGVIASVVVGEPAAATSDID